MEPQPAAPQNLEGDKSSFEPYIAPTSTNAWPGDYQNNILVGVYGSQSQGAPFQQQAFIGHHQQQQPIFMTQVPAGYGQIQQQQLFNGMSQSQGPFSK